MKSVLLATLLLLPTVAIAADDAQESAVFGSNAPPPARTQHFTVETFLKGTERAGVLETAYTDFLQVTNMREALAPAQIQVVIFPDEMEFRKKARIKKKICLAKIGVNKILSYEQRDLNSVLVSQTAIVIFNAATAQRADVGLTWLRSGLSDAVEAYAGRVEPKEVRARLRDYLKKNGGPISYKRLIGEKPLEPDVKTDRRFRYSAASLTQYLIAQDKGLGFSALMNNLAGGKSMSDAVAGAYPGHFRDMEELYDRWYKEELGLVKSSVDNRYKSKLKKAVRIR